MKKQQLNELIRLITRQVLKEYSYLSEAEEYSRCVNCGELLDYEGSGGRDTETMGGSSVEYLVCPKCGTHHEKVEGSDVSITDAPPYPDLMSEYSSMSSTSADKDPSQSTTVSTDELSPAEKSKIEREKRDAQKDQVKQKEEELSSAKKEMDYQKKKVDLYKRFTVPNLNKDLQRLKGSQI